MHANINLHTHEMLSWMMSQGVSSCLKLQFFLGNLRDFFPKSEAMSPFYDEPEHDFPYQISSSVKELYNDKDLGSLLNVGNFPCLFSQRFIWRKQALSAAEIIQVFVFAFVLLASLKSGMFVHGIRKGRTVKSFEQWRRWKCLDEGLRKHAWTSV